MESTAAVRPRLAVSCPLPPALARSAKMAAVNRVVTLLRTPAILIERFDHVPGVAHRDPETERARSHAVSFVDDGAFGLRIEGGAWRNMTARHVFVATPGLEFSCRHDGEGPRDRC